MYLGRYLESTNYTFRRALPGEPRVNGAGAPPGATLGVIGQVASRLSLSICNADMLL